MGGMMDSFAQLLGSFGIDLPPWGMPAIVLMVLVILSPSIWRTLNMGKARKLLKRASIHEGQTRQELEQQALDVVRDSPPGLVALAEEAERRGRRVVARAAVSRLLELDPKSKEGRRLKREMAPKLPNSAVEMELVIERMVEAGTLEPARERLARARRKWPAEAQAWDTLQEHLDQAAEASGSEASAGGMLGG